MKDVTNRGPARLGNSGMPDQGFYPGTHPLLKSGFGEAKRTSGPKRCFVLDPSHDADPAVRQHADKLWRFVIEPAATSAGYAVHRADRTCENGPTDQPVIDALLDDDLIIAVASFGNPRVSYEAALAQAAARPLILMIEDGQDLGFDPRNAEIVPYRLDGESLNGGANVARLQTVIHEVEDRGGPSCHGFRQGAVALNAGGAGGVPFERTAPSRERKLDMMRKSKTRIDVMGVANLDLAMHPGAADVLRSCAARGVEIRILQCAPNNPGLMSLIGGRQPEQFGVVSARIAAAAQAWRDIAEAAGPSLSLTIRRTRMSLPMANMLITDHAVMATPYLHSRTPAASPTLFATASDAYHHAMEQEFAMVWAEATTLFRFEPHAERVPEPRPERPAVNMRPPLLKVRSGAGAGTMSAKPARTKNARGFAIIRPVR